MINSVEQSATQRQVLLWLALSLCVPLYFGIVTLIYVASHEYIVQDDARQHVVFLQHVENLFPQDLIADYFAAVAPPGYKALYWAAALGAAPTLFAKGLPLALGLVTTVYIYFVCLRLFPVPLAGFIATLILNQHLWMNDDLVSATPRAFVYPIFAAFLYYFSQRSLIPCLITIGLQGLFFPQLVFVQVLVLLIDQFTNKATSRSVNYLFTISGVLIAGLVLLPYALDSPFGNAITAAEMRSLPEYGLQGRNEYFGVSGWQFWLFGNSGIRIPWFPSIILAGLGLPFLQRSKLPLVHLINREVRLGQVLLASLIMFGLAHLLLLKLHFPSRYTFHTLRMILAIAAGIVLTVLLNAGWRWLRSKERLKIREKLLLGLAVLFIAVVIVVPAIPPLFLPFQGWVIGKTPAIYQYLSAQPRDTLVASLAAEANNLPAFSKRSTLTGREFALPHHPQYYNQFRQRTVDLVQAQYSFDLSDLTQFINKYDIDFFLIEQNAFTPAYLLNQDWLFHSSFQDTVIQAAEQISQQRTPAMLSLIDRCGVATEAGLVLVDAACVK